MEGGGIKVLINSPGLRVSVPGARLDGQRAKATSANERHRDDEGLPRCCCPGGLRRELGGPTASALALLLLRS